MDRLLRTCTALLVALALPARAAGPRELVVFAASSLREAFAGLGETFERQHPGTKVIFALAGSQELRTQIEHGAPADVFASADWRHMRALMAAQLVASPRTFARNEPVLVVPRDNPAGLRTLADLPRARRIVVGAPEVPIGAYTVRILDAASRRYGGGFRSSVEARVVSRELNVRQVLSKVALGEADAAVVYRTDARNPGPAVEVIPIPPELNVLAEYPVAVIENAKEPSLARQFVDLLLSSEGQATLARFGFQPGTRG
ncbi:MAG: molybdate ABC transporter substrate-binding protein [Myxococcales bacterium]